MAKTLIGSPAGSKSLSAGAILTFAGLFAPFYPGSDEYPGWGSSLATGTVTPKTLIGAPA